MATTDYNYINGQYRELIRREERRTGRHDDFDGSDPFDRVTNHDDDVMDDYSLYRLGIK